MRISVVFTLALLLAMPIFAASKPRFISFGKPQPVRFFIGPSETKTIAMTVRALYYGDKRKEFTTGKLHDVTDRLFVVRQAFRLNDSLPEESHKSPRWLWQRGSWLLVDRNTGRVTMLHLPEFDPFYSDVSWYRDYAAYCGISDNGERLSAVVAQIGNRKPIYRKELGKSGNGDLPDSECSAAHWERKPARVTFSPKHAEKFTVTVSGRFADELTDTSAQE